MVSVNFSLVGCLTGFILPILFVTAEIDELSLQNADEIKH